MLINDVSVAAETLIYVCSILHRCLFLIAFIMRHHLLTGVGGHKSYTLYCNGILPKQPATCNLYVTLDLVWRTTRGYFSCLYPSNYI